METPGIVQLGLLMFAAFQTIYYYNKLPDKVASHFAGRGVADGWSMKPSLFLSYWIVIALVLAISLGIPALLPKLPRRLINIPHREYWLSDENYPEALRLFRAQFRWFGVILLSLQVAVFQMVFQANLSARPALGGWFIAILAGFAVALLVWIIRFTTCFSKVD